MCSGFVLDVELSLILIMIPLILHYKLDAQKSGKLLSGNFNYFFVARLSTKNAMRHIRLLTSISFSMGLGEFLRGK